MARDRLAAIRAKNQTREVDDSPFTSPPPTPTRFNQLRDEEVQGQRRSSNESRSSISKDEFDRDPESAEPDRSNPFDGIPLALQQRLDQYPPEPIRPQRNERDDDFEHDRRHDSDSTAVGPITPKVMIKRGDVPLENMNDFFLVVSALQGDLRDSGERIREIALLHARLAGLPSMDDPVAVSYSNELEQISDETRAVFHSLKNRIQDLERGNTYLTALVEADQSDLRIEEVKLRMGQVTAIKDRFKQAISHYSEVERESRMKERLKLERQVKIVIPEISREELKEVVRQTEQGGSGAMFSQALLSSGQRSFAARGALREAESRAVELVKIEKTLIELAQLFNDMALMVDSQDIQIVQVEKDMAQIDEDVEAGLVATIAAKESAKAARKRRWCCFTIIILLILIIIIVVVVQVVLPAIKKNQGATSHSPVQNVVSIYPASPISARLSTTLSPSYPNSASSLIPASSTDSTLTAAPVSNSKPTSVLTSSDVDTDDKLDSGDAGNDGGNGDADETDASTHLLPTTTSRFATFFVAPTIVLHR